jgi:putative peptide zinc metalloprotease protein
MVVTHARLRWLVALFTALLLALALASPALAQGGGDTNVATAVNTKDDSTEIDIGFEVKRVLDGVVDQTNAAVAYSSCEACQTVAIAIQIVLVSGGVDVVEPANFAVAVNSECVTCVTIALAYQFVWGDGTEIRLTKEARRKLRQIALAFKRLEHSGASVDEVLAQTNDLLHQVSDVLATGIEPVPSKEGDEEQRPDEADGSANADASPTPDAGPDGSATPDGSAAPGATPSPDETTTPSPSATPEPSETAEPAPTATATPSATPSATP